MDRVRWSDEAITFRSLVDNPAIQKPALVQIGTKGIVVGEKINGEFIMASPCKVSGDRFDVMEEEIILSSKHTGVWRTISKATSKKEGHIHRLTTKEIERIHRQDVQHERSTPRSYICIRDVEAFELIMRSNDESVANGRRIERRVKQIEENVEFEITDTGEVEYTPSAAECTTQDYAMVAKKKQGIFLQLLLPGVVEEERKVRNRVVRAIHCVTKGESRKRHFLLEVNEQPCEVRPIASEGSTELRYLHSTQNLYDYMLTYGNDTVLYVKLLRGDPPIKAIEFDGYMLLKSTLNGDKIPICRVEDMEITLVSPDLPVKVKLPTRSEQIWRSLSEVRAAEVQCMQLSLALLARHESEMYVTIEADKNTSNYLQSNNNQKQRSFKSRQSSDLVKKHRDECEKVFGASPSSSSTTKARDYAESYSYPTNGKDKTYTKQTSVEQTGRPSTYSQKSADAGREPSYSSSYNVHGPSTSSTRSGEKYTSRQQSLPEQDDSYNRFRRTTILRNPLSAGLLSSANASKTKTTSH